MSKVSIPMFFDIKNLIIHMYFAICVPKCSLIQKFNGTSTYVCFPPLFKPVTFSFSFKKNEVKEL